MEAQYYTPEIEEFHIGFEFLSAQLGPNWEHFGWEKRTVTVDTDFKTFSQYLNYNRVKLLDREDIESLGWELRTDDNADEHIPEYTIYRWYFKTYSEGFCTIYDDTAVEEYCFRGKIKNKSELKKIMKQIGVDYDEANEQL